MVHSIRVLTAFGILVVLGIGTVVAADDAAEVEFPDYAVKFPVPKGWTVLKQETDGDHSWCVLQQVSKETNKATIVVYAGRKYIEESPRQGNLAAGKPFAASAWAFIRALAWSEGAMDGAPRREPTVFNSNSQTFGTTIYIGGETQVDNVLLFGFCAEDRPEGSLTIGCACTPKSIKRTQQVLETIVGKRAAN